MPAQDRRPIYESGECEVDHARRELRIGGVSVPVGGRAFEIIETLVQSAGELVAKDELMERVWPGAIVEENTLQVHISAVRKALGSHREMLKTESGRGYRLLGNWSVRQNSAPASASDFEPVRAPAERSLTSFPAPASDLIGRDAAVHQLLDLLSAYRVVTLTGPGGIGKTSLTLEVARNLLPGFDGDGALVDLAVLSDPALVPSAVAGSLGLTLTGGAISAGAAARGIGGRKLFLVLDNCEHVVDAAAALTETVVRLCPHTTVLATSREVLRIDGEYVYRVPPLDVPPADQDLSSDILERSAVKLFVARTRALHSDFSAYPENLPMIAAICRRLDGIPLAIEFAAARAATLGLAPVAARLDDRFNLLIGGRRTALPRHQTLRATLDWSYELLTETERQLLRRLAVFSGGFTLEAAIAAMGDGDRTASVADGIANLVAKSLVTRDGSVSGGRWRLLETIRAYGFEKLRESGEADAIARRHAEFFRDLLASPAGGSAAEDADEDMTVCAGEIDNIRAALDWAFSSEGDADIAMSLTIAAVPLWVQLSLMEECRERVERALRRLADLPEAHLDHEMKLYAALAAALMFTKGIVPEVAAVSTRSLEIAESLDAPEYQLRSLWRLWSYQISTGQCRVAFGLAEKFSAVAAESGNTADRPIGDRMLGVALHYLGDQPSARRHIERMLARYVAPLHPSQIIRFQRDQGLAARAFLARILWLQGSPDQAMSSARTVVEEAQAVGHALSLCATLAETACPIALEVGDLAAAAIYVRMLLDHSAKNALDYWRAWGRSFAAELTVRSGDAVSGLQLIRAGFAELGDAPISSRFIPTQGVLAKAFGRAGRVADGLAEIDAALDWCRRTEERLAIAELLRIKGELVLLQGKAEAAPVAEDHFRHSMDWAQRQGALSWELRTALSLARLNISQGHPDGARQILGPIYGRFTEGFETADLRAARAILGLPPSAVAPDA